MEPEKTKWINAILNSLDGLQRAEPSPFLFAKIQNRLAARPDYVPMRTVWLAAASFALLAVLNWQLADSLGSPAPTTTGELEKVITDLHLYPATNQFYDVWSGQNY